MPKFLVKPYTEFLREFYQQPQGEEKRSWFAMQQKAEDKEAELYIYDYIGMFGVEPMAVIQALREVKGMALKVRLNTPGGSAFDGFTIYNALKEHQGGLTVIVDGMAASAGSLIAMVGEKIIMNTGSRMMIHDAWGITMGNADDHLTSAELLNSTSADLAEVYSNRTGVSKRMIRQMMKAETYMNAKQAKEQGFADEISGQATQNNQASWVVPEGMYKNPEVGMNFSEGEINPNRELKKPVTVNIEIVSKQETLAPSFSLETEQRRLRLANA